MISVLVVHKIRLTCDLTASALCGEPDIKVHDCAFSADEALAKLARLPADIALVNINLPDNQALLFTRAVARTGRNVKVVITGLIQSKAAILRYIEEGAAGYVLEEDSLTDLVRKIRRVHANEFLVSPRIGGALAARLTELKRQMAKLHALSVVEPFREQAELTTRESEILALIDRGYNNAQIAKSLVIEMGTVKNHVHNILRKLNVQSRKHAVIFARQQQAQATGTGGTGWRAAYD